ncbi:MAG TPA: mercuric transporter MerT family protein [Chthoniobacterales bacterium]|nr:mercuric transporter MerT family protein [Chthoniobacterales bacterium]
MKAGKAGVVSALLASVCCIGPLLLVAIGLGSGAALIGRYHWFFLIGALAVLTWSWAKYLREKTVCDCEHTTMPGRRAGFFTLLIATVIVLGFAGLNISRYVFASAPPATQEQPTAGTSRMVIPVEGMTCATCEIAVRRALNKVDGVKAARVSVISNSAEVDYDPQQTTPAALAAAIDTTGYKAKLLER